MFKITEDKIRKWNSVNRTVDVIYKNMAPICTKTLTHLLFKHWNAFSL